MTTTDADVKFKNILFSFFVLSVFLMNKDVYINQQAERDNGHQHRKRNGLKQ